MSNDIIKAAGGLVWRINDGNKEILLVHRPKYDDWSLPKGKLDTGESWKQAAVREVLEETGYQVEVTSFAGNIKYSVGIRPKEVRFWNMRITDKNEFIPTGEISKISWLKIEDAIATADYEHDRQLIKDNADKNI